MWQDTEDGRRILACVNRIRELEKFEPRKTYTGGNDNWGWVTQLMDMLVHLTEDDAYPWTCSELDDPLERAHVAGHFERELCGMEHFGRVFLSNPLIVLTDEP